MIHNQLPPLNAIRAFDAVVQQGSIRDGAEVLCVSQSAVSRHIKHLEEFLGCRLMHRHRRGVVLTASGAEYHRAVHSSLVGLFDATTKLRQSEGGFRILRVSALSSFALRWLVPRITNFQASNVGIALDVSISDSVPDFTDSSIDCAVVSDAQGSGHQNETPLFPEELHVVCAPELVRGRSFGRLDDINKQTLLHTGSRHELWNQWRQQYGVPHRLASDQDLFFQDFYIAIAAAVSGIGFALVPSFLVEEELATKQLVAPISAPMVSGRHYQLVISERKERDPAMVAFKKWMLAQSGL
ncbi:MAG: LysR family transcriptional regulator [Gammaproteobacteria bacterium]|nr:LysR family transcriptional regulator [Gammaproteobacteria bacterium]